MNKNIEKIRNAVRHNSGRFLALGVLLGSVLGAMAVTEEEMEKAKVIAAKNYIRYANNMSGYLDESNPKSMAELEGLLKNETDKKSFQQFKTSSVPSDYSSWDKDKLVEYWSQTFFNDNLSRLSSKAANNGEAKLKIKKAVQALHIAPPVAPEPEPESEPEPEVAQETQQVQQAQPIDNTPYDPLAGLEVQEDQLQNKIDSLDSLAAAESAPQEEKSSGTWVYIMVLSILVVVVIALVAYASRTMKGSRKADDDEDEIPDRRNMGVIPPAPRHEERPAYSPASSYAPRPAVEESRMREKYAESIAAKSEEIMQLSRQLADMEMLAAQLKEENRILKLEIENLKNSRIERPEPARSAMAGVSRVIPPAATAPTPTPSPRHGMHEVYLGRVNSRGIFVRADRQPVEGQSIYKLTTSNGISGTFSLVSNPALDRQLLSDPEKWLSGGCFANDLYDTKGRYAIQTETPGTAVFKDGAWRVERKSKIRYE